MGRISRAGPQRPFFDRGSRKASRAGWRVRRRRLRTTRGALLPANGAGGQHLRRLPGASEARGDFGFDAVDEQAAADGRAGRDRRVEPVNLHHRVADWRAGVEHQIGEVLQLLPVARLARLASL